MPWVNEHKTRMMITKHLAVRRHKLRSRRWISPIAPYPSSGPRVSVQDLSADGSVRQCRPAVSAPQRMTTAAA